MHDPVLCMFKLGLVWTELCMFKLGVKCMILNYVCLN